MWLIKSKTRTSILSLTILSLFLIGILSTSIVASSAYQHTLTKGTDDFVVEIYNGDEWKTTVNSSLTPSDWIEGEANITKAKSKTTLLGWVPTTWGTWQVFTSIFMQEFFTVPEYGNILYNMTLHEVNETTINANYTTNYNFLLGFRSLWNYTSTEYEEDPREPLDRILILPDPLKYKVMLDDYNTIAEDLNANRNILTSNDTFKNVNADEFLWKLIFSGFATAGPHGTYLESLVSELGCQNTSVSGSTLIIERHGITNYTVEISYGERGTMSSFTVKNISGEIIYKISSSNSEWLFYLILIIVPACSVVLVVIAVIRSRKRKR